MAVDHRREAHLAGPRDRVLLGAERADDGAVAAAVGKRNVDHGSRHQAGDAAVGHVGLDFQVVLVDQRHHRIADPQIGAGLGMAMADHPRIGRRHPPPAKVVLGKLEAGARPRHHRGGGGHRGLGHRQVLDGVVVARLVEGGRGADALEAGELVALLGEPRFGRLAQRRHLAGGGAGEVATPGQAVDIEHRQHVAGADAIADLYCHLGDRAFGARRHHPGLAGDEAADHRHRLR